MSSADPSGKEPVKVKWRFRVVPAEPRPEKATETAEKATETSPRKRTRLSRGKSAEAAPRERIASSVSEATETAPRKRSHPARAEAVGAPIVPPPAGSEAWAFRPAVGSPKPEEEAAADGESYDIQQAMSTALSLHQAYVNGSVFRLSEAATRGDTSAMPPEFAARVAEKRSKRKRLPRHKVRRETIQVALSEEEYSIVCAFVEENGFTLSGWAREALFAAMRRRIPPRRDP